MATRRRASPRRAGRLPNEDPPLVICALCLAPRLTRRKTLREGNAAKNNRELSETVNLDRPWVGASERWQIGFVRRSP
jgi:hypothetical protein